MMTTLMFSVIGLASELFDSRSMYMYHSTLTHTALQAATILVAMASEKNIWRLKF